MRFQNSFYILLVVILCMLVVFDAPAAKPDKSSEPLNYGLEALKRSDLGGADRWFEVTARDFPKHVDGLRALILQLILRSAKELAYVKVARYLHEGVNLELRDRSRWQSRMQEYETVALKWGDELYKKALLFIERDPGETLDMRVELGVDSLKLGKARDRLLKGKFLEEDEFKDLERGEWLTNMIGLLREVMQIPDSQLASGAYEGKVVYPALYRAVGVRLYIVAGKTKKSAYYALSRRFFERVVELTKSQPYSRDRQKAVDFLSRLDSTPTTPVKKETPKNAKQKK